MVALKRWTSIFGKMIEAPASAYGHAITMGATVDDRNPA